MDLPNLALCERDGGAGLLLPLSLVAGSSLNCSGCRFEMLHGERATDSEPHFVRAATTAVCHWKDSAGSSATESM
jgi:hypothetical protein